MLLFRHKEYLKALALAIYIKRHVTSSLIKNWTVSKICSVTGISATTVKKRIQTLRELQLIKELGRHLLFVNMKSSCQRNNLDISKIKDDTVKDIERSLQAILVVIIQQQKNYANLQLQHATDGRTYEEVKKGQCERKLYGWQHSYTENGLSYKRIAEKLGVCLKSAFDAVAFGIKCGFFSKISHFDCFYSLGKGAKNLKEVPQGYTFISKKGYLWKVRANTYVLSSAFSLCSHAW